MLLRNTFIFIAISIVFFCHSLAAQITVQGVVSDTDTAPVAGALVELIDLADNSRAFSSTTDSQGWYSIQVSTTEINDNPEQTPGKFNLLQNYPNPFNPSTVISYEIPHPVHVRIEIYNVLGQKIRTLFDGYQSNLYGRSVWEGTNEQNMGVAAGVYIYSLITDECRINRKMLLLDGHLENISTGDVTTNRPGLFKEVLGLFILRVSGPDIETYTEPNLQIIANTTLDVTVTRIAPFIDIDGNIYKTVKIGDQVWMAENLKVTHYQNGEPIICYTDTTESINSTTGVYCYYDNDINYAADYGALYNWYVVKDERNIAPNGWHVPSDEEWQQFEMFLGMSQPGVVDTGLRGTVEGGMLKETGFDHWNSPNTGATNSSGFTARPGGYLSNSYNIFYGIGQNAFYWTAAEFNTDYAWARVLSFIYSEVNRGYGKKKGCYSIRLVRD